MDLFVMICSIGLSTRFKQINDDLERIKGKVSEHVKKLDTNKINVISFG